MSERVEETEGGGAGEAGVGAVSAPAAMAIGVRKGRAGGVVSQFEIQRR